MNQLTFAIQEIEKNANLSEDQCNFIKTEMDKHEQRMEKLFPNYDLFITGTGQSYGLKIESNIINTFNDIIKHSEDSSYDADANSGDKIEIKSVKALKGNSKEYIGTRILNLNEKTKIHISSSFQQVKPSECDWFLFHILYGNAERIFLVPSKMISKTPKLGNCETGKILLSAQHRSHQTEGQVNIGQILSRAEYFEICCDYSCNKINAYSFESFKKDIEYRMNKINWILPN